jgi:hypothetical protein
VSSTTALGSSARHSGRGYEVRVLGQDGTCAGADTDGLRASDRVNLYLEGGRVNHGVRLSTPVEP